LSTLLANHVVKSLFERRHANESQLHHLSLENMISKQQLKIKSSIVDTNNCLNRIFLPCDSLNKEFFPGSRLIDIFSSCFSFHKADCKNKESKAAHCYKLDEIVPNALSNPNTVIIISDVSIRNNVTISITYVHSFSNLIRKTLHYAINTTITEAKLFAIRCKITSGVKLAKLFKSLKLPTSLS